MDPHYFIEEDGSINENYENASYSINDSDSKPNLNFNSNPAPVERL